MSDSTPQISSSSIVLVGSFNPTIFQPEWFARQGLMPKEQVEAAQIKVIVPEVSHFETEQVVFQVTQERFIASSNPNANAAPLRDLVQGAFFILEHTPVTAMGLNRHMHFPLQSEATWHQVGDKLAPKDPWIGILEGSAGLQSLFITTARGSNTGGWREKEYPGARYTVRVEPSTQIKFGVYFETNEHYPAPKEEPLGAVMKILGERWEESQNHALRIANHILDWAGASR
jgi:hypothetical protein